MSRPDGGAPLHLTTAGDKAYAGSHATLHTVTVNTPAANTSTASTLTIYDGTSTTGTKVATVDCHQSVSNSKTFFYNVRCANGVYAQLTGGAADITISIF